MALHFSAEAHGITSADFQEKKAVTSSYYIGSGYEFFTNENSGNDMLKYAGAQKMSPTKLYGNTYLKLYAIQLRKELKNYI